MSFPKGYGLKYEASDRWLLNHMIHNLTPVPTKVYMVLEIDFIPRNSPAARGMKPVRPIWMDVRNGQLYPVFNVEKGAGENGSYTYPSDEGAAAYRGGPKRNEWTVDRDGVLVATAGHLHPGGLHTDLWVKRRGARLAKAACASEAGAKARKRCRARSPRGFGSNAHLFRSRANYYEPAGAVSWDVAMTGTRPDWRVKLRKGDKLWTSATYNTKRAAWWESMGIMVAYMADAGPGKDPFRKRVDYPGRADSRPPRRERQPRRRRRPGCPTRASCRTGTQVSGGLIDILDFKYAVGDMSLAGPNGNPPVIRRGQTVTFRNLEGDGDRLYHSITSCKAPCNRKTGIAYPIAGRAGPVRVEHTRRADPGGGRERVEDARQPQAGHIHLLLPDPPVHAGRLPGRISAPVTLLGSMSEDRGSAADQVKALVEAAERIRADAEREAGEARTGVERVAQRADELRARLDELAAAVEAAVSALKDEVEALHEPSEAPRDELIAEAEAAAAREPEPVEPASEPERGRPPSVPEGARLLALKMALDGRPREETAGYLRENFELDDPEALLDEVYARAGG